jgi:hypothetical protein
MTAMAAMAELGRRLRRERLVTAWWEPDIGNAEATEMSARGEHNSAPHANLRRFVTEN